jgi:MFS family permease
MLSIFRTISALLSAVVLFGLANGLFFTLLGIRMSADGVSTGMIGLVGSAYFAGMLVGTLICERIIRRVGHIRAFTVFGAVLAVAALLHPLIPEIWVWILLRFAMGFAMAGYFMIAESWLQFESTTETRGRTFAFYILAHTVGVGLGPLVVILADPAGYELFAVASILYSIALLPVALTALSNPELGESSRFGIRDLYALSPVAVVGAFAVGLTVGAFSSLGPVYGQRIGLSTTAISLLMMAPRLGGFLSQYPAGMMSDRYDRRRVMFVLTLATVLVSMIFGVASAAPVALILILAGLYGGASQPVYSLVVAHANDHVEPDNFVAAIAGLLFAHGVGASIGPTAAAGAMAWFGPAGLFLFIAAVLACFAGFIVHRMARREGVPADQKDSFVPATRNAPATSLLDPRAPWEKRLDPERQKMERMLDESRWR